MLKLGNYHTAKIDQAIASLTLSIILTKRFAFKRLGDKNLPDLVATTERVSFLFGGVLSLTVTTEFF
ncbi:hypothetical protein MEO40_24425 [Dolichospermum sp. ST_sed1]|nr:hypothetical protein [Dolichospermum sp. ST_sed1]MDD1428055.1 hypothetical protein [Dolichospermum sp. ST_sed9]MDD1434303.1 hypothetical protein [Dolichospermum sp. ST_sed6]MDD1457937.1 hypothetical protein [Dolichospermum sp. ST_sed7]MDD1463231.1 hypothetical protein [Dolichospermum sp. ST_sed2]MDD1468559.1 hypothetical protein [Dolichospermum sp. ST_sed5]MDD1470264.1 hypothetical protein [Dolichospermum sp. ST_sed4]